MVTNSLKSVLALTMVAASAMIVVFTGSAGAQSRPSFDGTWHTTATLPDDPGWVTEDYFCFFGCTVRQIEYFGELLDDPANDDRPLGALSAEASDVGDEDFLNALTPTVRAERERRTIVDNLEDICTQYGYFGITVSVMPLRITEYEDHLEFFYETHDSQRTIYWEDSAPPPPDEPTHFGYSVARIEDGALVIETSHVAAAPFYVGQALGLKHSDQLTGVERYVLSDDGRQLDMVYTVQDPEVLTTPLMWDKKWRLSNDVGLVHHEYDCSFTPGQR